MSSTVMYCFNVELPTPGARARGLGMEVVRSDSFGMTGDCEAKLLISEVDSDPRKTTPVAEWNIRELRKAWRSEDEQHQCFDIQPGDKICAVNGMHGDDMAMSELLAAAADLSSPKAVNLTLERSRSDVLGPPSSALPPRPPTRGTTPHPSPFHYRIYR